MLHLSQCSLTRCNRLEVGTESALDRSKSIKTFLMTLFAEHGNYDVEARPALSPAPQAFFPHMARPCASLSCNTKNT